MADAIAPWGKPDRQRVVEARQVMGHSQEDCAQVLSGDGLQGCEQSTLSRWETGAVKRPHAGTVAILRAYSAGVEVPEADTSDAETDAGTDRGAAEGRNEPFDSFVRDITDEPFIGPRQGAFVDAITERLRNGPPMSDADDRAREDQMVILRLPGIDRTASS